MSFIATLLLYILIYVSGVAVSLLIIAYLNSIGKYPFGEEINPVIASVSWLFIPISVMMTVTSGFQKFYNIIYQSFKNDKEKKSAVSVIDSDQFDKMITKEKFQAFVELQNSGTIKMTDIVRGARLSGLSEYDYEDIMWNYGKYKQRFSIMDGEKEEMKVPPAPRFKK